MIRVKNSRWWIGAVGGDVVEGFDNLTSLCAVLLLYGVDLLLLEFSFTFENANSPSDPNLILDILTIFSGIGWLSFIFLEIFLVTFAVYSENKVYKWKYWRTPRGVFASRVCARKNPKFPAPQKNNCHHYHSRCCRRRRKGPKTIIFLGGGPQNFVSPFFI